MGNAEPEPLDSFVMLENTQKKKKVERKALEIIPTKLNSEENQGKSELNFTATRSFCEPNQNTEKSHPVEDVEAYPD